jgi:hypothetical protein
VLGRGWESGVATIVARQTHEGMYHSQAGAGLRHHTYDFVADVRPDSGAPVFRATFTELFRGVQDRRPDVGDVAKVKFQAKSKSVKFDRDALRDEKKMVVDAFRGDFEALAAAEPSAAPIPRDIESVAAARDEAVAKGRAKLAEHQRAKETGDPEAAARALAEVQRYNLEQIKLTEALKRLRAVDASG